MYLLELQDKLINLARARVKAGQITERGLARLCDVSQPHMHNVLKSARTFSSGSCDRLMRALGLEVSDLLWRISDETDVQVCAVPMVRSRIGPGTYADFSQFRGHLPMPGWLLTNLIDPIMARLAPDLVMPAALAANDLVLLDQNPAVRAAPPDGRVWIMTVGAGLRARYLRVKGGCFYASDEATRDNPQSWSRIPSQGQNILDVVRARIVWIGREVEAEPAGPADPARQSHRGDS